MNPNLRIQADNDQDRAHADDWMREATPEAQLIVWQAIQALGGTPVKEIISRLAALAFAECVLRVRGEEE